MKQKMIEFNRKIETKFVMFLILKEQTIKKKKCSIKNQYSNKLKFI